jgi:hypothetical protein
MRTTLRIDPEVPAAARRIAAARSTSLGEVISELARRGLRAGSERSAPERFPVFKVPMNARVITPQRVAAALDDHD